MSVVWLITAAFIPALFWAYIAVHKKATALSLGTAFFAAAAAVMPVFACQQLFHLFIGEGIAVQTEAVRLFIESFITAAFIEEGIKTGFFVATVYFLSKIHVRRKNRAGIDTVDEETASYHTGNRRFFAHNLLLTAVFFGLTFSGFENISYGIRYPQFRLLRLSTASVLHGVIAPLYVQIVQAQTKRNAFRYFMTAILLHGLYNFFVTLGGWFYIAAAAVICKACLYIKRFSAAAER